MTTPGLDTEEIKSRWSAIAEGPWKAALAETRGKLGPAEPLAKSGTLSAANAKRAEHLAIVLRAHYRSKKKFTPTEMEVRDALDEALVLPQLYELAVQSGYLPIEGIRRPARQFFAGILWSPAAKEFVVGYDYWSVAMLAARVGVRGFETVSPPEPAARGALRFASFLAHLREFQSDPEIQGWLRFLDDYTEEANEQDRLWEYMRGKRKTAPARALLLLSGCQRFVDSLANVFFFMDDEEQVRFGMIHAYWLQKYFGYEFEEPGYVKNTPLWGRSDSWAASVLACQKRVSAATAKKIAKRELKAWTEKTELLEKVFNGVRRVAHSSRQARNVKKVSVPRS